MDKFKYTGTHAIETVSDYAKNYNNYLLSLILKQAPAKGKILDIGAGLGYYAERLKAGGYDVTCMELDEEQCKYMEEKGLTVVRSMDDIEDGSIDFIYSINVLEHIEDDVDALNTWANKLNNRELNGGGGGIYMGTGLQHALFSVR